MKFTYPVQLTPSEEGGFVVTLRDLPEVITQGESRESALTEAGDALDESLAYRIAKGMDIPPPSETLPGEEVVFPAVEMAIKAALHVAMRDAGVSKTELAKRLGVDEKEARRLVDPAHMSRLPSLAKAVRVLGKHLAVQLEA